MIFPNGGFEGALYLENPLKDELTSLLSGEKKQTP
jgi:hypothetical protein